MPIRSSTAEWHGSLREGHGHMAFGNGAFDGEFSFGSRFESGQGTNPEELIAAAHAGCFSMQLSGLLTKDGHPPAADARVWAPRMTKIKWGEGKLSA
jgi:lipoyl-dependent peroxiredoxin